MAKVVKKKTQPTGRQDRNPVTIPDLVILSLLAERPMHGYDVNATLEERKIREWAPVSRPQVYYSLDKLTKLGFIRTASDDAPAAGPERRVFETTAKGRDVLADSLEGRRWVDDRVYQPFLIWLALSWQAHRGTFRKQLNARRKLIEKRLGVARRTFADVLKEVGHPHHEAVWMLELLIGQMELEMQWIDKILSNAGKRAPARSPRSRD